MPCKYNLLPAQREFFEINHNFETDVALYQGGRATGQVKPGLEVY